MNEHHALPASRLQDWLLGARERTLELVSDLTDDS